MLPEGNASETQSHSPGISQVHVKQEPTKGGPVGISESIRYDQTWYYNTTSIFSNHASLLLFEGKN